MKRHALGTAVLAALLLAACGEESQATTARLARAAAVCTCVNAFEADGALLAELAPTGCAVALNPDGTILHLPACHPGEPTTPPPWRPGPDPGNPPQLP